MLQRFFILCSGADTSILDTCSPGERNKYAGIGATVFFTALMATIAASYALYTVFDNWFAAVFFGLLWGLLIFNLDRFIVSTIRKRDRFGSELLQAAPRIVLAVIIAIVISKPLEMKIFEKEIDQVLLEEKNGLTLANQQQISQQYDPTLNQLNGEIMALKTEVAAKELETNTLYDTYITEAEGTSGTKRLGKGPVYQEKRDKHDASLAELQLLKKENAQKITGLESQITTLNAQYEKQLSDTQPIIDGFDGLMARVTALGELPWLPSFFIFLLFLAIETSPIIAKLLSPKGPYDYKLEDAESEVSTWATQKVLQRRKILETDIALNSKVYEDLATESEIYDYKKKKAGELLKLQADTFHDIQVKGL